MAVDETEADERQDGGLFAALLVVAVALFILAITIGRLLDAPSGSIASWLASVSAFAALLAATYAAIQARRTFSLELSRDQRRSAAAERAEQADRVAAWVADPRVVHVANRSDLPIYDVVVEFIEPGGRRPERVGLVPPGEHDVGWPASSGATAVDVAALDEGQDPPYQVGLRFRDAAGRTWHRDENGQLHLTGRNASAAATDITGTDGSADVGGPEY